MSSLKEPKSYLETLPPELLSPILAYLLDLESLDNYLRASPAAFRVFNDKNISAKTFEAILENGVTHRFSSALIRIIALTRAGSLPSIVRTYRGFENFVVDEATPYPNKKLLITPDWEHPPISLPSDISPSILRGILVTNRRIQRLAFGCLDFYLARFRSLRPFHSAGFSFNNPFAGEEEDEFRLSPWSKKVDNVELYYPVRDIGPPSWLEQQRVIRMLWRIQLASDIQAEILASRITWPVRHEENKEDEEEMMSERVMPERLFRMNIWESDQEIWVKKGLEDELLKSVMDYSQEMPEIMSEARYLALKKECASVSEPGTIDDSLCLHQTYTSDMWFFFFSLAGESGVYDYYAYNPPLLQGIKFAVFRRLGFAIWSNARMEAYGLLNPQKEHRLATFGPYYEAWSSLLSETDKLEREKEIERQLMEMLESERRANFPHMTIEAFRIQFDP